MGEGSFQIVVSDSQSSLEDWQRAQKVAKSQLPRLTDDQKEVARKFKISEEEYARAVLAGFYGRGRQEARATRLGEEIQNILEGLGTGERVGALVWQMDRLRWIVRIQRSTGVVNVAVPGALADDVLDSGLREQAEGLRGCILRGLGYPGTGLER